MSDRTNLKLSKDTKEELDQLKHDGETWDGFFRRAADVLEADENREQNPGAPRCTECKAVAKVWTVENGMLVCGVCADGAVTPDQ